MTIGELKERAAREAYRNVHSIYLTEDEFVLLAVNDLLTITEDGTYFLGLYVRKSK